MNHKVLYFLLGLVALTGNAALCPDPETTSLAWGEPPYPWEVSPFSAHPPQGEANTAFVQANILVAGFGRGVSCTYRNSIGDYVIWQETLIKIPDRSDTHWIDTYAGYVCTESLSACVFYPVGN